MRVFAPLLGEVGELHAGAFLQLLETLDGHAAVGSAGEGQDRVADLLSPLYGRTPVGETAACSAVASLEILDLLLRLPVVTLSPDPDVLHRRPDGRHLLGDGTIISLYNEELRHRLSGDRLALALFPVQHPARRLCQLVRRVVQERRGDQILANAQVLLAKFGEGFCDVVEDVPVALCLPRRGDGRVERVDKRVHVRGGDVVLLVPGRRRQHDV